MKEAVLLDLGRADYQSAWDLQKQLVELRAASAVPDVFLILEHEHVFTMGRKGDPSAIPNVGVPIYHIERGGFATYHGPGQIVGYPIIHLEERGWDIRTFVLSLEGALLDATRTYRLGPSRVEGHPGVWVEGRKLASVGVAVQKWVTFHGFAYNVNTDLSYFEKISPCGLDPATITSLEKELGHPADFEGAKKVVEGALENRFGNRFTADLPASVSGLIARQSLTTGANL